MRILFAMTVAFLMIATASAADTRIVTQRHNLDIPAGDLGTALELLAKQSGADLVYRPDQVQGLKTEGAKGDFSTEEAVARLLQGTALKLSTDSTGAMLIAAPQATSKTANSEDIAEVQPIAPIELRLAQSDGTQGSAAGRDTQSQENQRLDAAANASDDNLQEIVVTAQKRAEKLQDVPISMSVIGGEQLDSARGNGLLEMLSGVPSVALYEGFQGSTTLLGIRGVNATSAIFNGSSPIGFYLDSLPFGLIRSAAVPNLNPYDLDRVEVLRGPQGTLYGASSLNGVVKVVTKDPDLDSFDVKALTSFGSTQGGNESYRGDIAINMPIIAGRFAARAVAGYEDRGGWVDSPSREDINDVQMKNFRLKLKGQATDNLAIALSGWHSRTDLGAPNISLNNDRRTTNDREPNLTKFDTASLSLDYQQPLYSVASATSYLKYSNASGISLDVFGPAFYSLPLFDTDLGAKTFSQEVLVNSNSDGSWRWSAGLFYRDAQEDIYQVLSPQDITYKSSSIAYFGQLTKLLFEKRLELTSGLRYFDDKVKYRDNPSAINAGVTLINSSQRFDKLSPKVTVTWHATPDATIYASYGEGFRSGFQQFGRVVRDIAPDFPPAGPDELANYEVGTKASMFGGKLSFDAAVYYLDWSDTQQVVNFRNAGAAFPVAVNAGAADGLGTDLAVKAKLLPRLEVGFDYAWNNLEFSEPIIYGGQIFFNKGARPPLSAEKTFGASLSYQTTPFSNGWIGRFESSVDYTSALGIVSVLDGVVSKTIGESMLIARSSLSVNGPDHWAVTAYVDNLTNSRNVPLRSVGLEEWTTRIRPRTVGMQVEYRFR